MFCGQNTFTNEETNKMFETKVSQRDTQANKLRQVVIPLVSFSSAHGGRGDKKKQKMRKKYE